MRGFLIVVLILLQACSGSNPTAEQMPNDCGSDHPAVGTQASFSTLFHRVSGDLTIVDNCTLQITNFNYDGGGPDVAFYAGTDQDYIAPGYFVIGERINGTNFEDATIVLELPEDKTLDDFNSLSVWCAQFGVNFGDAFWVNN